MQGVVIGLGIAGIACSVLAILIRVLDPRLRRDTAELLLSVALFALMWFTFIYLMVLTRYIPHLPQLYNKGIPLYYLIAPCIYFYVRLKLQPMAKIPAYWLIHAIPFLFGLIDIIPYMLVSKAEQQAFLSNLTHDVSLAFKHPYGLIDQQWHYGIKLVLSLVYLLAQWRMLFMADATDHRYAPGQRFALYGLTLLFSLFTLMQIGMVLNVMFNRLHATHILRDFHQLLWVGGIYLLFSIWLCVWPYVMRWRRPH